MSQSSGSLPSEATVGYALCRRFQKVDWIFGMVDLMPQRTNGRAARNVRQIAS